MATDAEGSSEESHGGYGVVTKSVTKEEAAAIGRISEKWRFDVEDCAHAREAALNAAAREREEAIGLGLSLSAADGIFPRPLRAPPPADEASATRRRVSDFNHVPSKAIGNFKDWSVRVSGRWTKEEDIMRLEGRALVMGYRHVLRNTSMLGTHVTALCDNLGAHCSGLQRARSRVRVKSNVPGNPRPEHVRGVDSSRPVGAVRAQPCR